MIPLKSLPCLTCGLGSNVRPPLDILCCAHPFHRFARGTFSAYSEAVRIRLLLSRLAGYLGRLPITTPGTRRICTYPTERPPRPSAHDTRRYRRSSGWSFEETRPFSFRRDSRGLPCSYRGTKLAQRHRAVGVEATCVVAESGAEVVCASVVWLEP